MDPPDKVNLPGATSGTIAEHDILISISEESINKQFKELYDKSIESTDLPPPPGTGFGIRPPTEPSKYLISHELNMYHIYHDDNGKQFDPSTGIFGHIKCPVISLKENDADWARITLEFETVKDAATPSSQFRYWSGIPPNMKVANVDIEGWKMSWCVHVDRHDFEDLNEIINDAKNPSSSVVAHPDTIKQLGSFKGNEFTACSIFCIFDDAKIADTFELRDKNGNKPDIVTAFMIEVVEYYKDLSAMTPRGKATPDNPFVLGYGLMQKVPDLETIEPTPKYFIPKDIRRTISPGLVMVPGKSTEDSKYTRGTLNFCILTMRDGDEAPTRNADSCDLYRNRNSGRLAQTLFDLTLTKEHDGVMGIARDLIWTTYLVPILNKEFHLDVSDITNNDIEDIARTKDNFVNDSRSVHDDHRQGWFTQDKYDFHGGKKGIAINDEVNGNVSSVVRLEWDSGLQTNRDTIGQNDALRTAVIRVDNELWVEYLYRYKFAFGSNLFATRMYIGQRTTIEVTPAKGGILHLEVKDHSGPSYTDGKINFTEGKRPDNENYGAWLDKSDDTGQGLLDKAWGPIKSIIETMASNIATQISDKLKINVGNTIVPDKKINFDSIGNRYIMPAGAVFNFSGIDLDYDGNLYSHVSFALGTGGVGTG